mgnify:FL=1
MDIEQIASSIYDTLGPGYSERVYHNAMEIMLRERNIPYESERIIPIEFHGHTIGNLRSDIVVDKKIVLEFKAVKALNEHADIQGYNYLRLTGLSMAYLINFPPIKNGCVEIKKITMECD